MNFRKNIGVIAVAAIFMVSCARETPPQNADAVQPVLTPAAPAVGTAPGTRRVETTAPTVARSVEKDDAPQYVEKTRSKKKSAAIIGGSAAAGAAIGALAGGGKGAAIGAIAGGAGGLVYDRTTAKKKERID
jgi:hypothetical protein